MNNTALACPQIDPDKRVSLFKQVLPKANFEGVFILPVGTEETFKVSFLKDGLIVVENTEKSAGFEAVTTVQYDSKGKFLGGTARVNSAMASGPSETPLERHGDLILDAFARKYF